MAIGKRIEEALERRKWSRNDLMTRVPLLTPQALSNLIRRDSARSEWDESIAEALGVSVMWLVYGKDTAYPKSKVRDLPAKEPEYLPDTIGQIVDILKGMSRDGHLVALGRIEELAPRFPLPKANRSSS